MVVDLTPAQEIQEVIHGFEVFGWVLADLNMAGAGLSFFLSIGLDKRVHLGCVTI